MISEEDKRIQEVKKRAKDVLEMFLKDPEKALLFSLQYRAATVRLAHSKDSFKDFLTMSHEDHVQYARDILIIANTEIP